jgi:hypothetical protein
MKINHAWARQLTKGELAHITLDAGCTSYATVVRTMEKEQKLLDKWHVDEADAHDGPVFTGCWDCVTIGRKLGLVK